MLIVALAVVEECLVVETLGGVRMVGAKHLLADSQGPFKQGFGVLILSVVVQVISGLVEKTSRFWQCKRIFVDELSTGKGMRKEAFTLFPCVDISDIRESLMDGSYGSFCPLALCLMGHIRSENCLHETMNKEQLLVRVALD